MGRLSETTVGGRNVGVSFGCFERHSVDDGKIRNLRTSVGNVKSRNRYDVIQ